jgi:hypothetical protein
MSGRRDPAGISSNGYGFAICGENSSGNVGTNERFDDTANTHTSRAAATVRRGAGGYGLNEYFINYITMEA